MSDRPQLVGASANPDKVVEIAAILDGVVDLLPRPADVPDVVEDADTLEGNARLKAVAICEATGLPAVADDTGLEVDALDGAPGVYAARYAGEGCSYADNRSKLLSELAGVADRRARFRTCVLVRWPDGREVAVDGVVACCELLRRVVTLRQRISQSGALLAPHEFERCVAFRVV